jgi:hypothetical protein
MVVSASGGMRLFPYTLKDKAFAVFIKVLRTKIDEKAE